MRFKLSRSMRSYFNSRPSARGDVILGKAGEDIGNFNSRPSARGDEGYEGTGDVSRNFNSRPSARGDESCRTQESGAGHISIHAPPRGATISCARV